MIQSRLAARVLRLASEGRGEAELVLNRSPAKFKSLFKTLVETLHLDHANLQPCSLRRGGASHDFLRHGSMERTLLRGHWASTQAARVYVQDAAAEITNLRLPPDAISAIECAAGFLKERFN